MTTQTDKTALQKRIESGKSVLLAQVAPPAGGSGAAVRKTARKFAGKVHALGLTDNSRQVRMSAMAAASLVAAEGVDRHAHHAAGLLGGHRRVDVVRSEDLAQERPIG